VGRPPRAPVTRDVTPAIYKAGSIKQWPNVGPAALTIAVRTSLPDMGSAEQDWFRMHPDGGGYLCSYAEVQYWPDLYIAP
jgi:hypothetical protein